MSPARFAARTLAMAGKETLHILRDPRFLYMAVGMPVLMIIIFGYAVTFDLEDLPLALADRAGTRQSRRIAEAFSASGAFRVAARVGSDAEIGALLRRSEVQAALVIPEDASRTLARGEPLRVQLVIDGSDSNTAGIALGYAAGIGLEASRRALADAGLEPGPAPLAADVRLRFNQAVRSTHFTIPGLVAVIMSVMGVILTALTVAREWEQGSMEQLFATPVGRTSIVLGKLVPYFFVGLLQLLLVLALGTALFAVPVRGSPLLLAGISCLFLLGVLGQGLLISVIARSQGVATQMGAVTGLLPALILSGFLFPVENMPWLLRQLSRIVPARYFITALRGILLKGVGLEVLWPQALALAVFAAAMMGLCTLRFRRRLEG